MGARLDITGNRYGRLVAISREVRGRRTYWLCRCDCGNVKSIVLDSLRNGVTVSCSCWQRENNLITNYTHRMSDSEEYGIWSSMIQRCNNKKRNCYKDYGKRGITVCERWKKFENFYSDVGKRPSSGHTLDRINNNDGYHKSNVRWATQEEQLYNRKNTVFVRCGGELITILEASKRTGLRVQTIRDRHYRGKRGPELFAPIKVFQKR